MSDTEDRVLAFEVGGAAFALRLADVREVADLGALAAVPMLPRTLVAVTNHRGDALPVVSAGPLLDLDVTIPGPPAQLLVLGGSSDEPGRLGLPVERVLGLAPAPKGASRDGSGPVRARTTHEGRLLRVLDGPRLLARADEVVAGALRGGRP